jgi:hypothetical protein
MAAWAMSAMVIWAEIERGHHSQDCVGQGGIGGIEQLSERRGIEQNC